MRYGSDDPSHHERIGYSYHRATLRPSLVWNSMLKWGWDLSLFCAYIQVQARSPANTHQLSELSDSKLDGSEREEDVMAVHLVIWPFKKKKPVLGWSWYQDVNPVPSGLVAADLVTSPSRLVLSW